MSVQYEEPPVVEAIVEFHFLSEQDWDLIPGLLYSGLKSRFPKKRIRDNVSVGVHPGEEGAELQGRLRRWVQFWNEEETELVQVAPSVMTANRLCPYPGWEAFRESIASTLGTYQSVTGAEDLQAAGVRYINKLRLPWEDGDQKAEVEEFLNAYPKVPEELPQVYWAWAQRVDIPFLEANGVLILQTGASPGENREEGPTFLLDLDFRSLDSAHLELENALDWVESAHEVVEHSFEAAITQKARDLFKGGPNRAAHSQ